jgi:hypothetical protein
MESWQKIGTIAGDSLPFQVSHDHTSFPEQKESDGSRFG